MTDLRITDAPEVATITGAEKIPTGNSGGNFAISVDSLAQYVKDSKDLQSDAEVEATVAPVEMEIATHVADLENPHEVTKEQVGLGNVDNTADTDKPISSAVAAAITTLTTNKADKTYVDSQLALKANQLTTYTKTDVDNLLATKANQSTTYTKTEVNTFLTNKQERLSVDGTLTGSRSFDTVPNLDGLDGNPSSVMNQQAQALMNRTESLNYDMSTMLNYYDASFSASIGGYPLNSRVVLSNGEIVVSTIANNTNDPNSDMTGWVLDNAASQIIDESGKTQQEINDGVLEKTYSLKDAGGTGGGADDTDALLNATSNHPSVLLDTDISVINQAILTKGVQLNGASTLQQNTQNRNTIVVGSQAQDVAKERVEGFKISGVNFGEMPTAISDDYAALFLLAADGATSSFNTYENTETGISASVGSYGYSKKDHGVTDSLSIGDNFRNVKRFVFQNLQGRNTRILGISAHNNGNNYFPPNPEINNGGINGGVRLAGISRGNILSSSNIRDRVSAVDFQLGSTHNILVGNYFENSYGNSISVSSANTAIDGKQNISGVTIKDSGNSGIVTRYTGHSRIDALIDTTGVTVDANEGYGVDGFAMVANEDHYIIEFEGGSGVVPPSGTVITQGAVTGVLVRVVADSLATVGSGVSMPEQGTLLVKTVVGGVFKSGILSGISATATRAYAAEGRNRIDVSVSNAKKASMRLATNSNLVDLLSSDSFAHDIDLTGKYNIVKVVVSDSNFSQFNVIGGSNNIVLITDNEKVTTKTRLSITGNNNIVIGNTSATVAVTGSNNYCDLICSRLNITGSDNDIGGQINVISDSGTGNKFNRTKKGQITATITVTTNSNGEVAVSHGLAGTAKAFTCNVVGSTELLHITVSNVANSASTSLIKVWNSSGSPAASKTLSISYVASI